MTPKRGRTGGWLAHGDPDPWIPLSFCMCLLAGGSLSDLVRSPTGPKCVTQYYLWWMVLW